VTITVVCCSPEKIKEKIICKGGEAVKSIEIKVPEKPKPKPEKKPEEKKEEPKPRRQPDVTQGADDGNGNDNPTGPHKPKLIIKLSKQNEPEKLKVVNVEPVHPRTCCAECYRGISGGPCYHDYGRPALPSYEIYGRPVHDSWGGSGGCGCQRSGYYACRREYVCEDNPSSCTIM
jgi:hypothetical protein